jgi:AP-2 complex subunit alpha
VAFVTFAKVRLTRDQWLERLSYSTEGVLYEDKQIQIGLKAEYHGHLGRIALFLGNKISTPFTSVSAAIDNPSSPALLVNFHDSPVREIAPLAQIQELIHLECKDVFTEPPVLRLTYLAGSFTTLVLRLPVFLNRFVEGVTLEQAPFFERWKIIGGEWAARPCTGAGASRNEILTVIPLQARRERPSRSSRSR